MPQHKKDTNDEKEVRCKNLGLYMDINVVHRYSHLGEKLLRTTYNTLGVKLTGTLQVCEGCAQSKEKSRVVRKKTYIRELQPRERIFVDTTGSFPESLIGN